MKRFIRYLYEYEQGRKLRNVGFVKVEQGEDDCAVHIHGKGLRMKGEKRLQLYLFYEEEDGCVGIWQGTVDNVNPAINYRLYYTAEDVGRPENFPRINGIILEDTAGRRYAGLWNETQANIEKMRIWTQEPKAVSENRGAYHSEKRMEEPGTGKDREAAEAVSPEPEADRKIPEAPERPESREKEAEEAAWERQKPESREKKAEEAAWERPESREKEAEEAAWEKPESREREAEEAAWERPESREREAEEAAWEKTEDRAAEAAEAGRKGAADIEEIQAAQECAGGCQSRREQRTPGKFRCSKIQRNDLSRLPRCEWKWSNNSFLLHGYYNYHHIALIEDGDKMRLGVPGIYHAQEAKAAAAFGFPEFLQVESVDVELTAQEQNEEETFGYWCRYVRKPMRM